MSSQPNDDIEFHSAGRPSEEMHVDVRFEPLAESFFRLFRVTREGGGALAVFLNGRPVVDIWAGWASKEQQWSRDTVALSFSTGKGVASAVVHRLAQQGLIDYDTEVAHYWPEFAAAGKDQITVRELMSHRAGLQRIRGLVPGKFGLLDHELVAAALAAVSPDKRRLTAPGYHAITYGSLVSELASRATGVPFGDLVRTEIAEPLEVPEYWFEVPSDQLFRIARVFPGINPFGIPWEATSFALSRVPRLRDLADAAMPDGFDRLVRDPVAHTASSPGWNGVFNARGLAKMYGAMANDGFVDGTEFLRSDTVSQLAEVQTRARDYVLGFRMNWRLGYHAVFVTGQRRYPKAFGHYGVGGSGAFADPESGLSLAFVTNRLGGGLTPFADFRLARLGAHALALVRSY